MFSVISRVSLETSCEFLVLLRGVISTVISFSPSILVVEPEAIFSVVSGVSLEDSLALLVLFLGLLLSTSSSLESLVDSYSLFFAFYVSTDFFSCFLESSSDILFLSFMLFSRSAITLSTSCCRFFCLSLSSQIFICPYIFLSHPHFGTKSIEWF